MRTGSYWYISGMGIERKTLREIRSYINNEMNLDDIDECHSYFVFHCIKGIEISLFTFFRIGEKIYFTKLQLI